MADSFSLDEAYPDSGKPGTFSLDEAYFSADEAYGASKPSADDQPGFFANTGRGLVSRGLNLAGGLLTGIGTIAEDAGDYMERRFPLSGLTEEEIARENTPLPQMGRALRGDAEATGFVQGRTWQDLKADPGVSNLGKFVVETAITSLPDMAGVLLNLPGYVIARMGETAFERAKNKGLEKPGIEEVIESMPSSVASAALERVGARGILGTQGANVATRVAKSGAKEAGTEAIQSPIEYAGEVVGTNVPFDPAEAGEQALAGAIGGGGSGAALRLPVEGVNALRNRQAPPAAEEAPPAPSGAPGPDAPAPGTVVGLRDPDGTVSRVLVEGAEDGLVRYRYPDGTVEYAEVDDFTRDMTAAPAAADEVRGDATTVGEPDLGPEPPPPDGPPLVERNVAVEAENARRLAQAEEAARQAAPTPLLGDEAPVGKPVGPSRQARLAQQTEDVERLRQVAAISARAVVEAESLRAKGLPNARTEDDIEAMRQIASQHQSDLAGALGRVRDRAAQASRETSESMERVRDLNKPPLLKQEAAPGTPEVTRPGVEGRSGPLLRANVPVSEATTGESLTRPVRRQPEPQAAPPSPLLERPAEAPAAPAAPVDPAAKFRELVSNRRADLNNTAKLARQIGGGTTPEQAAQFVTDLAKQQRSPIRYVAGKARKDKKTGDLVQGRTGYQYAPRAASGPIDIVRAIIMEGGIKNPPAEIRELGIKRPGFVNNKSGKTLSEMLEALTEQQYFGPVNQDANELAVDVTGALYDKLRRASFGEKVYPQDEQADADMSSYEQRGRDEFESLYGSGPDAQVRWDVDRLIEVGLLESDVRDMDVADMKAAIDERLAMMEVADVESAVLSVQRDYNQEERDEAEGYGRPDDWIDDGFSEPGPDLFGQGDQAPEQLPPRREQPAPAARVAEEVPGRSEPATAAEPAPRPTGGKGFPDDVTVTVDGKPVVFSPYDETHADIVRLYEQIKNGDPDPALLAHVDALIERYGQAGDIYEGGVPNTPNLVRDNGLWAVPPKRIPTAEIVEEWGDGLAEGGAGPLDTGFFFDPDEFSAYISDWRADRIPAAPKASSPAPASEIVQTVDGPREQLVIPGAEKVSDRTVAERRMEGRKRSGKSQQAADEGLFGTPKQPDIFGGFSEESAFAAATKKEIEELNAIMDRADETLTKRAEQAISAFVGHGPGAKNQPNANGASGIMRADALEDAASGKNQDVAADIETAFAPVREKMRSLIGDYVTLYRVQFPVNRKPGVIYASAPAQRSILSWSAEPRFAAYYAGIKKTLSEIPEEKIAAFEKKFNDTGEVQITNKKKLVSEEVVPGIPQISIYEKIDDEWEYATDTDSVRDYISGLNEDRREDRNRIIEKTKNIIVARVPLDQVMWATDRAGQSEFIVRNTPGTQAYVGQDGTAPNARVAEYKPDTSDLIAMATSTGDRLSTGTWADKLADEVAGRVVFRDGDLALIEGYSLLSGQPVYMGAKDGVGRTRVDIGAFTGNALTAAEKQRLLDAKADMVAADRQRSESAPDGPFTGSAGQVVKSESIPQSVTDTASEWLKMLGIKGRVFLLDPRDVRGEGGDRYNLFGTYNSARSAAVNTVEGGSTRRFADGNHYIAMAPRPRMSATLETLAHEIGHIFEKEQLANADPATRKAIADEHAKWLEKNKPSKAREYVEEMRAHSVGKATTVTNQSQTGAELTPYWKSFSEWFADQVSRWATTDAKPVSVVDKFFKRLADGIRRLVASSKGQKYVPNRVVADFLNSRSPADSFQPPVAPGKPGDQLALFQQSSTEPSQQPDVENLGARMVNDNGAPPSTPQVAAAAASIPPSPRGMDPVRRMGRLSALLSFASKIAADNPKFAPLFNATMGRHQKESALIHEAAADFDRYWKASPDSRKKIADAAEYLSLRNKPLKDTGRALVIKVEPIQVKEERRASDGTMRDVTREVLPERTKPGDTIRLNKAETDILLKDIKGYFDRRWMQMAAAKAAALGYDGEFTPAGIKAAAAEAQRGTDRGKKFAAKAAQQIYDAAEAGARQAYLFPLMRQGDYYFKVTPKDSADGLPGDVAEGGFWLVDSEPAWRSAFDRKFTGKGAVNEKRAELEKRFPRDQYEISEGFLGEKDVAGLDVPAIQKLMMALSMKDHRLGEKVFAGLAEKFGLTQGAAERAAGAREVGGATVDELREQLLDAFVTGIRKERRMIPGYDPDFDQALGSYNRISSVVTAANATKNQIADAVDLVEGSKDPVLTGFARKWMNYVDTPGSDFGRLRQYGFFANIWGSLGSGIVNLLQTPTITASQLSSWAGVGRGTMANTVAMDIGRPAKLGGAVTVNKNGLDLDYTRVGRTPAEREAVSRARADGILGANITPELYGVDASTFSSLKPVQGQMTRAFEIGASAFNLAEQINRAAAFLAAFRAAQVPDNLAKAKKVYGKNARFNDLVATNGLTPETVARFFTEDTQFISGKFDRPEAMRGFGSVLLQFKQYPLNVIRLLNQNLRDQGPEGRLAAVYMLSVLMALSGAMGLPFVEDVLNLSEAIYKLFGGGDARLAAKLRESIVGTPENGQDPGWRRVAAEFAAQGLGRMTPVDFTRAGIGRITPDGDLLNAIPVVSGTIGRGLEAMERAKTGQPVAATVAAAAPIIGKGPTDALKGLVQYPAEGVRTRRGDDVLPPDDLSAADMAVRAIGFQPSKVARASERRYEAGRAAREDASAQQTLLTRLARLSVDRDRARTEAQRNAIDAAYKREIDKALKDGLTPPTPQSVRQRIRSMTDPATATVKGAPKAKREDVLRTQEAFR